MLQRLWPRLLYANREHGYIRARALAEQDEEARTAVARLTDCHKVAERFTIRSMAWHDTLLISAAHEMRMRDLDLRDKLRHLMRLPRPEGVPLSEHLAHIHDI